MDSTILCRARDVLLLVVVVLLLLPPLWRMILYLDARRESRTDARIYCSFALCSHCVCISVDCHDAATNLMERTRQLRLGVPQDSDMGPLLFLIYFTNTTICVQAMRGEKIKWIKRSALIQRVGTTAFFCFNNVKTCTCLLWDLLQYFVQVFRPKITKTKT